MSTVSKTAGIRVPSTSGGGATRSPAIQASFARTDSRKASGPLRFSDLKFSDAGARQAAVDMLVQATRLQGLASDCLAQSARETASSLQDHLEDLSMYLRHAMAALPDVPESRTSREILQLASAAGFQLVQQVAALDMCATAMAERLEHQPAIGGVQ